MSVDDNVVGYRKPPKATRFRKGQSGNPRGRPRGRRRELPYESVLGQTVILREDGIERHVTAAEAFLLHMTKQALEGDSAAGRQALAAIEEAHAVRLLTTDQPSTIVQIIVAPGSVNHALEPLRIARKLDRWRETARMAIEPWAVEAALARMGDKRLTIEEQQTVVSATRTPWKVRWPPWWEATVPLG